MKKLLILSMLGMGALWLVSLSPDVTGGGHGTFKSSGPPSCHAGEAPHYTTCAESGCHDGFALNSGGAQLLLDLGAANSTYLPGQTYTFTIAITRQGLSRAGFQFIGLGHNDLNTSPGTITLTQPMRTQLVNAANPHPGSCATAGKTWVEHTSSGIDNPVNDTLRWQFNWQAPQTPVDTITFYVAGLDANFDGDNTGDHVYATHKTIVVDPTVGVSKPLDQTIRLYPNPASDKLFIDLPAGDDFSLSLFNLLGEKVMETLLIGGDNIIPLDMPEGVYLYRLYEPDGISRTGKILIR